MCSFRVFRRAFRGILRGKHGGHNYFQTEEPLNTHSGSPYLRVPLPGTHPLRSLHPAALVVKGKEVQREGLQCPACHFHPIHATRCGAGWLITTLVAWLACMAPWYGTGHIEGRRLSGHTPQGRAMEVQCIPCLLAGERVRRSSRSQADYRSQRRRRALSIAIGLTFNINNKNK